MTTAALDKPTVVPAAHLPGNIAPARPLSTSGPKTKTVLAGFDLGTNKSCILAGSAGAADITVSKVVPTVVGYVKDGIVDGIVAGNRSILFGEDALANMLHVRLVAPVA